MFYFDKDIVHKLCFDCFLGMRASFDDFWRCVCVYCCCSVAQSCPTFCDPMDCSTPGSSILRCLLEFAQILVH